MSTKPGDRIRLIEMPGDPHPIETGAEGTVTHVDPVNVGVDWDNGRELSLIPGIDRWEVLQRYPLVMRAECKGSNAACRLARRLGRPVHLIPPYDAGAPALVLPDYHYASEAEAVAALEQAEACAPLIASDAELRTARQLGIPYRLPVGWVDPERRR